jgi:hypothetical protein
MPTNESLLFNFVGVQFSFRIPVKERAEAKTVAELIEKLIPLSVYPSKNI